MISSCFFKSKASTALAVFLILSVVLRFFSFFPSVMDQDEATYFEIGRQLLLGKVLYVDYIDIKPPGMFWIMAGFQYLFGHSIFMIRLMSALWIGLTAWVIYRVIRLMTQDHPSGLAGGVIYIFLVSCWAFYGVSINTEIFFNLFTVSALYFLLRDKRWWNFLLAGLMAGIGFVIKYVMVFDFATFILFYMFLNFKLEKKERKAGLLRIAAASFTFLIPFAFINLQYYYSGNYEAFREIIFEAPARYPSEFQLIEMIKFILDFIIRFIPAIFFFIFILIRKNSSIKHFNNYRILAIAWTLMALIAVIVPGNTFGHYTIQLMLPVSVFAGFFFHPELRRPKWINRLISPRIGLSMLTVVGLIIIFLQKVEFFDKPDIPEQVAAYLEPQMTKNDRLYTGNFNHILYFLLKKDSPTPYLHQSLLDHNRHIDALQIDVKTEFERVMGLRPLFIVSKGVYPNAYFESFIQQEYQLDNVIGGKVHIYKLRSQKNVLPL